MLHLGMSKIGIHFSGPSPDDPQVVWGSHSEERIVPDMRELREPCA